jgi:hypothetical protein
MLGANPWVLEQTGRPDIPGAYTEGFMVLPHDRIFKVPLDPKTATPEDMVYFCLADAVACGKAVADASGLTTFEKMREFRSPKVLIIGGGRLGTTSGLVAQDLLKEVELFCADTNMDNLKLTGETLGIEEDRWYKLPTEEDGTVSQQAYLREAIKSGMDDFDDETYYDVVIDTAGIGAIDGETVNLMLRNIISGGGGFCTTAHTGIYGIEALSAEASLKGQWVRNALTPMNEFPYAIEWLAKHGKTKLDLAIKRTPDLGLELTQMVADGGYDIRSQLNGTIFYTHVRD